MNTDHETETPNSPSEGSDFDVSAVVAEIGRDLAGADATPSAEGPTSGSVESPPAAPVAPAISEPVPGQNSVSKPLPKSWKKDMAPVWEKLPPAVHEYVYEREANVMRGLQQYQSGHEAWQTVVKPFAPVFQQHPDVNPVQVLQGLMNTHLQLLSAPAEKKRELAQRVLEGYGIDLTGVSAPSEEGRLQQELRTLRGELDSIKSSWTQRQLQEREAEVNKHVAIIDAFAKDPKNEFFNELADDIHRFIQTGAAKDIATAYELACWANPLVRAKLIAKQQPAPAKATPQSGKASFVNVESDGSRQARPRKPASIDDTVEAIVSTHYSRH